MRSLEGKVVVVIGASRGIGRTCAIEFARAGAKVVLSAKTVEQRDSRLKGTIQEVLKEINEEIKDSAIAIKCDVKDVKQISNLFDETMKKFGRIDVLYYNAGAIFWETISNTPLKRFDLLHEVNARGSYSAVQQVLPIMKNQSTGGHIILVSPPIYSRFFKGKGAYAMSKIAMSILTITLGEELKGKGIAINSIWPATAIKSQVTDNMNIGDEALRKPEIFADACISIAQEDTNSFTGNSN